MARNRREPVSGRSFPRLGLLAALAVGTLSCNAFKRTAGPDQAAPVNPPQTTSVTVEYDQVPECVAGSPRCEDNVVFFGSWMQPGEIGRAHV